MLGKASELTHAQPEDAPQLVLEAQVLLNEMHPLQCCDLLDLLLASCSHTTSPSMLLCFNVDLDLRASGILSYASKTEAQPLSFLLLRFVQDQACFLQGALGEHHFLLPLSCPRVLALPNW